MNNRTLRVRIIAVPAVAVNRSRRHTNWPWQHDFTTMLENLRALPGPAG